MPVTKRIQVSGIHSGFETYIQQGGRYLGDTFCTIHDYFMMNGTLVLNDVTQNMLITHSRNYSLLLLFRIPHFRIWSPPPNTHI